jgi:hypothetical protein
VSQFKGTYVFSENGIEIGRSSNLITSNGRKIILQYLSGLRTDWAQSIAIGALSNTPSTSDIELNFETGRFPVTLKTFQSATSTSPDLVVLRTTLPANMYANIYEVGAYPNTYSSDIVNRSNRIFTDFSDLTNWVTSGGTTYITGYMPVAIQSPRIGAFSVELTPNTTYYNNNFNLDISGYTAIDNLELLVYNTVAGNLNVKFTDVNGYSASFSYNLQTNTGYQSISTGFPTAIQDQDGNTVYSPSQYLSTINSISITTDSTAVATIDVIKGSVTNELSPTDYIISKSVLSTPIAKNYGTALDIEYYIELL